MELRLFSHSRNSPEASGRFLLQEKGGSWEGVQRIVGYWVSSTLKRSRQSFKLDQEEGDLPHRIQFNFWLKSQFSTARNPWNCSMLPFLC